MISCMEEEVIVNEEEKGKLVIGGKKKEGQEKGYLLQCATKGKRYQ